jgi:hypothetical protein
VIIDEAGVVAAQSNQHFLDVLPGRTRRVRRVRRVRRRRRRRRRKTRRVVWSFQISCLAWS